MTNVNLLLRIMVVLSWSIVFSMPKLYLLQIEKVIPSQYLAFTRHSFNKSMSKGDFNFKRF